MTRLLNVCWLKFPCANRGMHCPRRSVRWRKAAKLAAGLDRGAGRLAVPPWPRIVLLSYPSYFSSPTRSFGRAVSLFRLSLITYDHSRLMPPRNSSQSLFRSVFSFDLWNLSHRTPRFVLAMLELKTYVNYPRINHKNMCLSLFIFNLQIYAHKRP